MPDPKLSTELSKMQPEPLLPIEKRLVAWSIGIGLLLLAVLVLLSRAF